jgi:hypothetical protein
MKSIQQRNILIVCALGQESQIVKSSLKGHIFQWIKFYYHTCGLWLEKSMINLTQFLSKSDIVFDVVINIWLAWYIKSIWSDMSLQWTLVQSLRIIQWDVKKELCVPPQYTIDEIPIVTLTSRYRVVRERSQLESFLQYEDVIAVDMEWYSIEYVCDIFRYPRLFLKILYDEIWKRDVTKLESKDMIDTMKHTLEVLPEILQNLFYK